MSKKETLNIKGTEIVFYKKEMDDFISLTDIAKVKDVENPSQIISLWLRTYNTIEYLGLWEMLNNIDFKPHIYEGFKNESAKPHFWMSAQKQPKPLLKLLKTQKLFCGMVQLVYLKSINSEKAPKPYL